MADELGSTAPSGLSRALGVRGPTTPFLLGAAGAAAFVGSLVLDWENATLSGLSGVDPGFSSGVSGTVTVGVPQNNLGLVYLVGTLALIVALGAVLTRPATALRMRLAVSGLGVGLLGVVLSFPLGGADQLRGSDTLSTYVLYSPEMRSVIDGAKVGYEAGFFCAMAAVVLLVLGVWFAAGSVAPVGVVSAAGAAQPSPDIAPPAPSPAAPPASRLGPTGRAGFADGLTVTSGISIDPGTNPDILRG